MGDLTYSGKSFELTVDNGVVFHNTYTQRARTCTTRQSPARPLARSKT